MDATTTLSILGVGIVVVVGGILALRLHAFLALVLGALAVASLTSSVAVRRYAIERDGYVVATVDGDEFTFLVPGKKPPLDVGMQLVLVPATGEIDGETTAEVTAFPPDKVKGRRTATAKLRNGGTIETGSFVVTSASFIAAGGYAKKSAIERVVAGFGSTAGKIGILIAMASIIGKCLLDSGAADRIVRSALKLFGEGAAPVAFIVSGFALGIPVFFDTVFYLMIPLGKALRTRTGRNYLLYVLAIVTGGTMAHSLVPPTPGPLFVAEELGVDLGTMILGGCIVGFFTVLYGYVHAVVANRLWDLPLRPSAELSLEKLEQIANTDESELPPIWLSLLPILLPVVLIGGNAIVNRMGVDTSSVVVFVRLGPIPIPLPFGLLPILGDKNIALIISAAIAMGTLVWWKKTDRDELLASVSTSLASGGVIILITSAGGAFGGVLKETGVAGLIRDLDATSPVVICTLAFLITTAVRTAQGSATVAMITAVGVLGGLVDAGLGFHPVYLALAIGCGSKPVAWMNDSGFWVITKMSGMTEAEGLKYVTPMTTMMGVVGLVAVLVGVTLFPLV